MTAPNEWTGPVGDVWAAEWRRTDRSFAGLSPHLESAILRAMPETGTLVDIGCGAGGTSLAVAAARPSARIVGLDISAALVAVARERAADLPNARFDAGDAPALVRDHAPVAGYYSRHGVMFFPDPIGAFAALRAAATPGAPLEFSCFRKAADNVWAQETIAAVGGGAPPTDPHAPGPFAFADPDHVRVILAAAGWSSVEAQPVDFAYRAGEGDDPVTDAVSYFRRIGPPARALRDRPEADRPAMIAALTELCERYRTGDAVDFPAAAWIWSARA
ncbi:class I SAM-dependent methyltransferase [Sphingomonas sp.]|uniref:class I SAM-dependent methyltransferase n=1 Tax=Sphingomonas sp. TaxID=28214 RepID=UPI002C9A9AFE|nr:class I SAM-dependent methyltransferase [Sphingomonas sp.]HWK35298.1 class I SAM-dependent methyltransferase [Sphingomonas sp.]